MAVITRLFHLRRHWGGEAVQFPVTGGDKPQRGAGTVGYGLPYRTASKRSNGTLRKNSMDGKMWHVGPPWRPYWPECCTDGSCAPLGLVTAGYRKLDGFAAPPMDHRMVK